MKKNYLYFVVFAFLFIKTYAQELPNIIPPSPDVYRFTTFGNIPLNGSSGGFGYTIPLFNLNENDIPIDISLNYYSNGINIDAISSVVGISWNLNVGGAISRVVRGYPDEIAETRWYPTTINYITDYINIKNAADAEIIGFDTEPDWFSFSVNGISGEFYFDENLNIHINSDSNIEIKFNNDSFDNIISSFEIIDEKGYIYKFGGEGFIEVSLPSSNCSHIRTAFNSSWFLSEIISPTKNKVIFSYQPNSFRYTSSISNSITFDEKCLCDLGSSIDFNTTYSKCISYNQMSSKILSKIQFSNGEVEFKYNNNRIDMLSGGVSLDEIIFKNTTKTIEKYKFIYQFISAPNHKDIKLNGDDSIKNRFYLTEVLKEDFSNTKEYSYKFEYYNKESLPCRLSYDKDMFGYYNASNNSTKPFAYPKDQMTYLLATRNADYLFGANKEVNPQTSYYGMLKEITYPTGGSSIIEYEANSDVGLFEDGSIENHTISLDKYCDFPRINESFTFISNGSPINFTANANIDTFICDSEPDAIHDKYFISIRDLTAGVTVKSIGVPTGIAISTDPNLNCNDNVDFDNYPVCTINGHEYQVTFEISSYFSQMSGRLNLSYNKSNQLVEKTFYGGGIRVKKIIDISENKEHNIRRFYYNELSNFLNNNTSMNKILDPKYSQHFTYFKNCLSECCANYSGPVDLNSCYENTFYLNPTSIDKNRYFISSNSLIDLYNNRKQDVYYTAITEFLEDGVGQINGVIEKKFQAIYDDPPINIKTPEIPNIPYTNTNDVFYGQINEINYYKLTNNILNKIKTEKYNFNVFKNDEIRASVFQKNYDLSNIFVANENVENISISQYKNILKTKKIISKEEILYDDYSQISAKSEYKYDNLNHLLPTRTIFINSKGQKLVTKTYYPDDVSNVNSLGGDDLNTVIEFPAIIKLKEQHRISEIIQVDSYEDKNDDNILDNSELLNRQRTNYKIWNNDIVLPKDIETLKGIFNTSTNNSQERIVFYEYDSTGHPKEISIKDAPHIYYIWGYNQTQPIAKIENFTSQQVPAFQTLIDDAITASNADNDRTTDSSGNEGALRQALKAIQTNLPVTAQMTYFTYDPLIGVTSITDPKGDTQYYIYDEFNRLKQVIDKDGNILSENQYHYRGQNLGE